MAFVLKNLNAGGTPGAKGRAPVIYTYTSEDDSLAAIKGSGYFNAVNVRLETGDFILVVSTATATGAAGASLLQVAVSGAGVVTTARSADLS